MTKPTQKVQRMSGEIQMQADLSHCLFSVPNGKKLPVDQKLTKIIASGWFWIVFLFGIENGAQLDKSWQLSVHTKTMLTMLEPRNYLMVVRGNRIGKEGQQ